MRFGTTGRLTITAAATVAAMALVCGAATPAPTLSDVQQKFDEGDYTGTIAGATRLLAVTGTAAASVDKGQLYTLKADAHLHLKQFSPAADAYTRGAKAATDPKVIATDSAMAVLVKKSRNGAYTPKKPAADGAKATPIDITASTNRKTALAALFDDEFTAGDPRLKAAATSTSILAIQTAADLASTLRNIEVAATDGDEKTKPEIDAIVSHAHDLLDAPLQSMAQQVDKIKTAADAPPRYGRNNGGGNAGGTGGAGGAGGAAGAGGAGGAASSAMKTGLTSQERSDLQNVIATATKIGNAADALAKSTDEPKGLPAKASSSASTTGDSTAATAAPTDATATADAGAGGSPLDALVTDAQKVVTDAEAVLNANYGHPGAMGGSNYNGYGRTGGKSGR